MSNITNRKGFTLIELLAVIIILGVLMIIAIPAVTEYISSSRKNAYITTASRYIDGVRNKVNAAEITVYDKETTYYIPGSCVSMEKGGKSPYGDWEEYYVVVTYDGEGYDYYWTSRDESNTGIYLTYQDLLDVDRIENNVTSISTNIGVGDREKVLVLNNSCDINDAEEIAPITKIPEKSTSENEEILPSFTIDSWDVIAKNIKEGNTKFYNVGDTKKVTLTGDYAGTYTLRIANISNPAECLDENFSQTSCGFVIEFEDVIAKNTINSTSTNIGGYPASQMYYIINNDIFKSLPEDLKNVIIYTKVISSHGNGDKNNFITNDKLFLLSTNEVWGKEGTTNTINFDTSDNYTRQLDYYKKYGVNTSNQSKAVKQFNDSSSAWWLRTSVSYSSTSFCRVGAYGGWNNDGAYSVSGISPAFRIG